MPKMSTLTVQDDIMPEPNTFYKDSSYTVSNQIGLNVFHSESIQFCGYKLDSSAFSVAQEHLQAVKNLSPQTTPNN